MGTWLKVAVLVALAATGFLLLRFTRLGELFDREQLIATFDSWSSEPWAPVLLLLFYAAGAVIGLPMTPLVIVGGVVFGPWLGFGLNLLGLLAAAMSGYWVARVLGRDLVVRLGGERLRRAERIFEKRGFWPLVQVRFTPVPFSLINFAAAFAGVAPPRYLISTTLGLIPATFLHTYFMARIWREWSLDGEWNPVTFAVYLSIWAALAIVTGWSTYREGLRRRQRYRELRARRTQAGR
jgi:uncharacterized membrane protein YdjX (TVP38/TMEM64 family)